jgi:hypothetical protein
MKYTILLTFLFVGSLAKGQGSTLALGKCCIVGNPVSALNQDTLTLEQRVELLKSQEEQDSKKSIKKVVADSNFIIDFLNLYDEYSKACDNDSVWYHYHGSMIVHGNEFNQSQRCEKQCKEFPRTFNLDCPPEFTTDYGWHHPGKSFEGFIEYLKNKRVE